MSTSSSEEGSGMAGHHVTSSGLESTASLLFSLPSDGSDVQTATTPPTSPTPSESECKMHTPKDILDASRRLGRISTFKLASQGNPDVTPTGPSKQFHRRVTPRSVANNEAGYDADGDGEADADGNRDDRTRAGVSIGTTAPTRPTRRRPAFPRIDTRQHRRVASMLATLRPTSPGPGDTDDVPRPPLRVTGKLAAALPSIRLLKSTTTAAGKADSVTGECYELRRRPRAELVGLGIGFPEHHPLRDRAFSMPVRRSAPPTSDFDEPGVEEEEEKGVVVQGQGREVTWRSDWLPTQSVQIHKQRATAQGGVHEPCPVRIALRPTFLESSPSPVERLPAWDGGVEAFRCVGVHYRSEIMTERERYRALAREGWLDVDLS